MAGGFLQNSQEAPEINTFDQKPEINCKAIKRSLT